MQPTKLLSSLLFFDDFLLEMFLQAGIDYSDIYLVTQLDWIDSSYENRKRIDLIWDMLSWGINVEVIDRLHAKILVVDWEDAFFGSQNFTRYGTGSVEITTYVNSNDDGSVVFDEIRELFLSAQLLREEDLDRAVGLYDNETE
jgi:PLD-like domain